MTAFDLMNDALFHDANLGVDAVYRDPPSAPTGPTVRLLFTTQADQEANLGMARGQKPQVIAEVRASDVPAPAKDATLTLGARVLTIAAIERDRERLVFRLTLREAP
jgi:hypothetical protein